jgi:intein/homing endonuclease
MADHSHRAIESIRVGERVLGYDTDHASWVTSTVTRTVSHAPEEGTGVFIVVNDSLRLTSNHPVWAGGHATAAEELKLGDSIVVLSPDGVPVSLPVRTLARIDSREVTYDIDVDGPGTFVAGNIVTTIKPL